MSSAGMNYLSVLENSVLPEYSVSPTTGFAPPSSKAPATKFSSPTLNPWLDLAQKIPQLLAESNTTLRAQVDALPAIEMSDEAPMEEWRLAYVALSTLAAAYVWGTGTQPDVVDRIPYGIAAPLREVAYALEVEPGMTYASGSLWNHLYREGEGYEDEDARLDCIVSFTGTSDETHFNLTTLRVERAGGESVVQGMLASQMVIQAIRLSHHSESHSQDHIHSHTHHHEADAKALDAVYGSIAGALRRMASSVDRCTVELTKMRAGCAPDVFYNQLRPFLTGFGSNPSLPKGVWYPTEAGGTPENGKGEWLKLSGSTAGQSSLFQALDVLLDVKHPAGGDNRAAFVKSMRKAMPGCHVQFLESLGALPSLRKYMQTLQSQDDTISKPALEALGAYNSALRALEGFRSEHIKIVTLYVIGPARRAAQSPASASGNAPKEQDESQMKGTGGSNLASLLKGMRTDTNESVLERDA